MKKLIGILSIIIACSTLVYAADSASLLNIQNNYQSAKADFDNKQNQVTKATDDVTLAKNNLDKAQKDLQQAQKDLKDAQINLQQKKDSLVKSTQDLAASKQNMTNAANAIEHAWKK